MNNLFETERLRLRPTEMGDIDFFFKMFQDKKAIRFMPTLAHQEMNETLAWISGEMSRPGAHYWTILHKEADRPIGYANFLGGTRLPGMGYMIHPDYWGQGLTPEACRPVLKYGYRELGYDRVELWIDQTNQRSVRVAEKLGFKLKARIPQKYSHEKNYHFMLVYGLLAAEWGADDAKPAAGPTLFRAEPVLMVHDVQKTVEYYRDRLGFIIDFVYGDPADHASVSRGEWTGNMVTIQITHVPKEREITPAGYLYLFADAYLDTLYETYKANGVDIVSEPTSQPWGLREFVIRDLNGHVLVFGMHI